MLAPAAKNIAARHEVRVNVQISCPFVGCCLSYVVLSYVVLISDKRALLRWVDATDLSTLQYLYICDKEPSYRGR